MPIRLTYGLGFLLIVLLLTISLYLQFFDHFIPCPLCSLQRLAFLLLGIFFLIGMVAGHKRWLALFINSIAFIAACAGLVFSGRQIWLQHFANNTATDCGVSLQYMLEVLPPMEVVQKIFAGSAECTQIGWQFLGLDMAEWSFLWFIFFVGFVLYLFIKNRSNDKA
jgi:protein dithiol:quinone oxidoreductase